MSSMTTILHGTVHGKRIELDADAGLPDGQPVTVLLTPAAREPAAVDPLEALRRAAGSWSDDPEGVERYVEWTQQQRQVNREEPG